MKESKAGREAERERAEAPEDEWRWPRVILDKRNTSERPVARIDRKILTIACNGRPAVVGYEHFQCFSPHSLQRLHCTGGELLSAVCDVAATGWGVGCGQEGRLRAAALLDYLVDDGEQTTRTWIVGATNGCRVG